MELGDVQIALDLGPTVDTTELPAERRVRHALELARAYSARNRRDEGLAVLLRAERMAPEQVRHHFISRQLVYLGAPATPQARSRTRRARGPSAPDLAAL